MSLRLPALLLLAAISGCGDVLGPERMPVTSVSGKVSEYGRPVAGGWIEFVPVDGTVGKLRSAYLRSDGTFRADKVSVGLNAIRLVNIDITDNNAKWLFEAYHSPIRRIVPDKPGVRLTIDLFDEYTQFAREYQRQHSLRPAGAKPSR